MPREYVRDKRSPTPSNDHVSKVMSSNKAKDTSPEMTLRRSLRENGASGYRLQWRVPGRPDIAYPGKKVAIFVNGCFWHRCPYCDLPPPKNNTDFWINKFERNKARDEEKREILESNGWIVLTIWECSIKSDLKSVTDTVLSTLLKR
jgi:DNA mismatch endonuclease (patch repair protein)